MPTLILCPSLAKAFYLGWGMHCFMMGFRPALGLCGVKR